MFYFLAAKFSILISASSRMQQSKLELQFPPLINELEVGHPLKQDPLGFFQHISDNQGSGLSVSHRKMEKNTDFHFYARKTQIFILTEKHIDFPLLQPLCRLAEFQMKGTKKSTARGLGEQDG